VNNLIRKSIYKDWNKEKIHTMDGAMLWGARWALTRVVKNYVSEGINDILACDVVDYLERMRHELK